jgi:hypothetical protein
LSRSGNGNFPIADVYTKPVKKIIFGKIVFSEKENRLNKINIVWIYVIQVRKNKTRCYNNADCNKLLVARGKTRTDGNYSIKLNGKGRHKLQIRFSEKKLKDFRTFT